MARAVSGPVPVTVTAGVLQGTGSRRTGVTVPVTPSPSADRQLALLKFSIEAGILLCGNGVLHAMLVARPHARTHTNTYTRMLARSLEARPSAFRSSPIFLLFLPCSPYPILFVLRLPVPLALLCYPSGKIIV